MKDKIFKIRISKPELVDRYYSKFINDIINHKCVLIVGSGISQRCIGSNRNSLPNWYQFIDTFISWLHKKNKISSSEYQELEEILKNRER